MEAAQVSFELFEWLELQGQRDAADVLLQELRQRTADSPEIAQVGTLAQDFSNYRPALRRPDPGSCRPVALRHPYRLFRLKEQNRLAAAFDGRRYEEARELAEDLRKMSTREEVRGLLGDPEADRLVEALSRSRDVARAYAFWSEGFYGDARQLLEQVDGLPLPPTVEILGRSWPHRGDDRRAILEALSEDRVFADPVTGLAYFLDVLVWNDAAAIRTRPRACYLRLYGAVESVFFYAFDAFVGREPARLVVTCEDPGRLAKLEEHFPTSRLGTSVDWPRELHRAAVTYLKQSSLGALRVLFRRSGRITPQIDLQRLLGPRADQAAGLVPKIRAEVEPPPLPRGLHNRLLDSKKGGLSRFNALRNKAVHWMAPVPTGLVVELRAYYQKVLGELIPPVVEHLGSNYESRSLELHRLETWSRRVVAAATGERVESCEPVAYRRLGG